MTNRRNTKAKAGFPAAAALIVLCALILCALLCGCTGEGGNKEDYPVPIGLIVYYMGPDVKTTDHVFSADDFAVIASYEDGTDENVSEGFEFEQLGLKDGYYFFRVAYHGCETTDVYVRCSVPVYPSDRENQENPENPAEPSEP